MQLGSEESRSDYQVLVVDDDASIRRVVTETLEDEGYSVVTAADGEEAFRAIIHRRPGVVLLDMRMPNVDGWELTRRLKARGIHVPVAVMTAAPLAPKSADDIGADAYIAKPFELSELVRIVEGLGRDTVVSWRRADLLRAHLAAVVESSDDAIVSTTLDGIITSWNPTAEHIYGYAAAEVVGQSIATIVPTDRLEELAVLLDELRRGRAIEQMETARVRRDGTRIAVSLSISPIRDASGQVVGATSIGRDITEEKRVEAFLREASEAELDHQLEQARQAGVVEGARGYADRLNNALAEARSLLAQVKQHGELSDETTDLVDRCVARLAVASRDVEQLEDVVRTVQNETPVGPAVDRERSSP